MSVPAGYVQLPSGFWVGPNGSGPFAVDVATGAVTTPSGLTADQAGTVSDATSGGAAIATADQVATQMPDEVVLLSASGCACASPCYLSKIRCVTGTTVALTVYDNPAASAGTQLYSGTLSAGQEAVLSAAKVRAINGVRGVFASGTFEFSIGQELP